MSWSWQSSLRWWPMKSSLGQNWTVHLEGYNGLPIVAHWRNHFSKLSGNGRQRSAPPVAPTNYYGVLPTSCTSSLRRTTTTPPHTHHRGPVMLVPQTTALPLWEGGFPTTQPQNSIKFGGFITKWRRPHILGPSRTRSLKGWLQPWRCLGHWSWQRSSVSEVRLIEGQSNFFASDNQGNVYGLLNEYTKKMPTAGLLMEVMFQLTANTCTPLPKHVKREFNQWADDLTHPSFTGFDSALQLQLLHFWMTSRPFHGSYDILINKETFQQSWRSLPLLSLPWRDAGNVNVRFGWSLQPTHLLSFSLLGSG